MSTVPGSENIFTLQVCELLTIGGTSRSLLVVQDMQQVLVKAYFSVTYYQVTEIKWLVTFHVICSRIETIYVPYTYLSIYLVCINFYVQVLNLSQVFKAICTVFRCFNTHSLGMHLGMLHPKVKCVLRSSAVRHLSLWPRCGSDRAWACMNMAKQERNLLCIIVDPHI